MASWMVHLRVAEAVLKRLSGVEEKEFIVGNIAPDSGVPNADWTSFSPPSDLSHFRVRNEDGKKEVCIEEFVRQYFAEELQKDYDGKTYAFFLGYLVHLLTDILWKKEIFPICIAEDPLLYEQDANRAIWTWKKDFYDLDAKYLRDHPEFHAFSVYENAVGFDNTYMDLFARDAIDNRREYIVSFYRKKWEGLDREYPYLNEKEMGAFVEKAAETIFEQLQEYTGNSPVKKAWYLDEDVLLVGAVEGNSFFPEDGGRYCGFYRQDFEPEDIGITVFFDLTEALAVCGDVPVIDSEKRKEYREE